MQGDPAGQMQPIDIGNAPFAQPDLAGIARVAKRVQEMNDPIGVTPAD